MKTGFRVEKNSLLAGLINHGIMYPTPLNLNYFWSFGSAAGILLVFQILTGIFLSMHYVADINLAFNSVEHIMRDVNNGWFLRYMHANGASVFFILVYIHIFRGLYYGSFIYPRGLLWVSGVVIFISMMATAFLGYVLPWGQMSFWGATVITNLFSAIPVVGHSIVEWLWGGFSVTGATLNRFYSLHFLLPFVIVGLVLIHLSLLHKLGSNNPIGVNENLEIITFHSYFSIKDVFSFLIVLFLYLYLIFYKPNLLGHSDNYIVANSLVTPAHIVPEWYFLPFYAILRSIPDKLGGVIAMFSAIVILLFLPVLNTSCIRVANFRPLYSVFFWFIFVDFLLLGWIGQQPVETPFIELGLGLTIFYFIAFIFIMPLIGLIEYILIFFFTFITFNN